MSQPWEQHFEEMLVDAWERELALFFKELAWDLEDGLITVEEAYERIKQIHERKDR